jgi:hypothetical protein
MHEASRRPGLMRTVAAAAAGCAIHGPVAVT